MPKERVLARSLHGALREEPAEGDVPDRVGDDAEEEREEIDDRVAEDVPRTPPRSPLAGGPGRPSRRRWALKGSATDRQDQPAAFEERHHDGQGASATLYQTIWRNVSAPVAPNDVGSLGDVHSSR